MRFVPQRVRLRAIKSEARRRRAPSTRESGTTIAGHAVFAGLTLCGM